MVEKVLGEYDEYFDDFAVGGFGRWSIGLRPLLSSFFRETLENFITIQSWKIQNGDFGKSLVGGNRYLLSSFPPSECDV